MRSILFTFFQICLVASSFCQQGQMANAGARSIAMGRINSTLQGAEAIFANPAGLDYSKSLIIHLAAEQRFLISGLSSVSAGISKNIDTHSALSVSFSNFGIEEYKEINAKIAYSRKIIDRLNLGIGFNYFQFRIQEYGSKSVFNTELGMYSHVNKDLHLGFYLKNPFRIEITKGYNIPTSIHMGASYKPSTKANIHLEFEKQIDFEQLIKFGLEYQLLEEFTLRAGFRTNPASASFGFALKIKDSILVNIGFDTHPYLDISPGMSMIYQQ